MSIRSDIIGTVLCLPVDSQEAAISLWAERVDDDDGISIKHFLRSIKKVYFSTKSTCFFFLILLFLNTSADDDDVDNDDGIHDNDNNPA